MIIIGDNVINPTTFNDGTMKLTIDRADTITWYYDSESELITIIYLAEHYHSLGIRPTLIMPYIPNARMDRVQNKGEVFTLKHFAKIINSLDFAQVKVLDPHSFVAKALIDRVVEDDVFYYINQAIKLSGAEILVYPDFGAYKRYHVESALSLPEIYGKKIRDWDTRAILRYDLSIDSDDSFESIVNNKSILIVDDIISTGSTMALAVEKLLPYASKISLYCSHLENTIFNNHLKLETFLDEGKINKIYTTRSIYSQNHLGVQIVI